MSFDKNLYIPSSDGCIYPNNEEGIARLQRNAAAGNPRSLEALQRFVESRMR